MASPLEVRNLAFGVSFPAPTLTVSSSSSFLLQGKKCVVIGGCGFLGQHLVETLLEKKANVTVFDLNKNYSNDKVEFIIGDLNSAEASHLASSSSSSSSTTTTTLLCLHDRLCARGSF